MVIVGESTAKVRPGVVDVGVISRGAVEGEGDGDVWT